MIDDYVIDVGNREDFSPRCKNASREAIPGGSLTVTDCIFDNDEPPAGQGRVGTGVNTTVRTLVGES